MQQPIKHLFNVLGVMGFACTALVISTTQNLVSHPSLRCYTIKTIKKLNCCEKLGYMQCFLQTTHSQMPIKLKQVLLLKKDSQLTPWSKVLLVTLTFPQLAKKFPAFYGTQRFIMHLPLPSVRQIQSTPSHPNIILSVC